MRDWPLTAEDLDAEQRRLALARPTPWRPPEGPLLVGGVFLAFARGQQGPGHPGDRGWAGAALVRVPGCDDVAEVAIPVEAGASYEAGRLALREGPALARALRALSLRPDVALIDATGRDHPRGAGLALHLGAVLDLPTIGVTHRPLVAAGQWPADETGAWSPLTVGHGIVAAWLRTARGTRPVVVHAGWRTDVLAALEVVRRCLSGARTPEPLRQARMAARRARSEAEGRRRPSPFP